MSISDHQFMNSKMASKLVPDLAAGLASILVSVVDSCHDWPSERKNEIPKAIIATLQT